MDHDPGVHDEAAIFDVCFRGERIGRVELADASGFRLQGRWHPAPTECLESLGQVLETEGEAWLTVEFLGPVRITSMPGATLRAELAAACSAAGGFARRG